MPGFCRYISIFLLSSCSCGTGFGNVGYYAAQSFEQHGAKVIGILEFNGALYCPTGVE